MLGQNVSCDSWFAAGTCFNKDTRKCDYGLFYDLFNASWPQRKCESWCNDTRVEQLSALSYTMLRCIAPQSSDPSHVYDVLVGNALNTTNVWTSCSKQDVDASGKCTVSSLDFKDRSCEHLFSQFYWHVLDSACLRVME